MFYAFVLICVVGSPNTCIEAADSRGPYVSRVLCTERVQEMIETLPAILPPVPYDFKYKCVKTGTQT